MEDRFKIHFNIHNPEEIVPWGDKLHWFGLTDSFLWITVGDSTIYELTPEFVRANDMDSPYNDYQLARFAQDFSDLLYYAGESVPEELYEQAELNYDLTQAWEISKYDLSDEDYDTFYFGDLETVREWFANRSLDSGHLVQGPHISIVRCKSRLKIIWQSYMSDGSEKCIWSSPRGVYEMDYEAFVREVHDFYDAFLKRMDLQIRTVTEHPLDGVKIDLEYLSKNHSMEKESYEKSLSALDSGAAPDPTNWEPILLCYRKMLSEIN